MKFQVTLDNPENPSEKVTKANAMADGITAAVGTYFPDGASTAAALTTAASNLNTANTDYEETHSVADEDAQKTAVIAIDTVFNNAILYVQGKVNAVSSLDAAEPIAHAAGMDIKGKPEKQPVPETVTTGDAKFTNEPNTVLITVSKAPKYTKWMEVWVTTTPGDESSWKLVDTFAGRRCMVDSLVSGTKYYFRLRACNSSGKSAPSNPFDQMAA